VKLSVVGLMILRDKVLLVQRGARVHRHKGEIGLPGGAVEPWETEAEALRREIFEEIGVDIVGEIPIFFGETRTSNSLFRIRAYAIFFGKPPKLEPDGVEVVKIHEVLLSEVLKAPVRWEQLGDRSVPVIRFSKCTVWGATGRLLLKFREWYSGKRVQLSFGEVAPVESQRNGPVEGRIERETGGNSEG